MLWKNENPIKSNWIFSMDIIYIYIYMRIKDIVVNPSSWNWI